MIFDLFDNDYDEDGFRTCNVTGMSIHRSVENPVKVFGLTAVVALVVGGFFAIGVALTRWEFVGLLGPEEFYRWLSLHAWNLLIFWMVFLEIAILYVGGPMVLGRRLPIPKIAKVGWGTMVTGALVINYAIWTTEAPNQAPLLTSYAPLPSSPYFYAGAIIFILGSVVAALPFFVSLWQEKSWGEGGSLPLITFGAFATSIIAVEALLGGLAVMVYAFLWRIEILGSIDAAVYRQVFWIIGHGTQQINLVAMVTVWYFLTHIVGGAEVVSEKVSRTAFVLYIFFINLGAAHHLLSDPVVSISWRIWNASYAFYGATLASLIHAFAIPAGIEAGRRRRGKGGGLFGWLTNAPWKNPVFSATIFSIILFGFVGGITGVVMGQVQLNMTWVRTLATVGHFHGTVALGTTIAFMGLVYFVIRTMFMREFRFGRLASLQPYLYAATMTAATLMLMYIGLLYGVPRRIHSVVRDIPGTDFSLSAAEPLMMIFGVFALLAIISGAAFVVVALASVLFGEKKVPGSDLVPDGGVDFESDEPVHKFDMRGTFVITLIFLGAFIVVYIANWYLLSQLWSIGP
jgi:cytochrome c oxidase subunit 1